VRPYNSGIAATGRFCGIFAEGKTLGERDNRMVREAILIWYKCPYEENPEH
jgi:hypothetical protein